MRELILYIITTGPCECTGSSGRQGRKCRERKSGRGVGRERAGVGVKCVIYGEEGGGGGGDRRLADWVVDGGGLFDKVNEGGTATQAHTRLRNFADPAAAATPRESTDPRLRRRTVYLDSQRPTVARLASCFSSFFFLFSTFVPLFSSSFVRHVQTLERPAKPRGAYLNTSIINCVVLQQHRLIIIIIL